MTLLLAAAIQQTLKDGTLGFELDVPAGFVRMDGASMERSVLYAYLKEDPGSPLGDIMLVVERLDDTIPKGQRLRQEDLPKGIDAAFFSARWKGHTVQAIKIRESIDGLPTVTINVQVPLKREAVRLKLTAGSGREAELDAMVQPLLDGLRAETNWDTPPPSTNKSSMLFVGIAIVVVAVLGLYLISRVTPRGTVLVIALVCWAAGQGVSRSEIAQVRLIGGVITMTGCAGAVLGLVDVFRKRKPPQPQTEEPDNRPTL